jgi:hypothetical protein
MQGIVIRKKGFFKIEMMSYCVEGDCWMMNGANRLTQKNPFHHN